MEKLKLNTKTMILSSFFTALIALGAFIRIPLGITVFSLQFSFVLLAGILLGARAASLSCLLYLIIGLVGFPVFAQGGGLGYILKPSFGYLLAFIPAAYIAGFTREKFGSEAKIKLIMGCILAMILTYLIGSFYTYALLKYILHNPIPYWSCLASLFPLALLKDIFSCILVSLLATRLLKILN